MIWLAFALGISAAIAQLLTLLVLDSIICDLHRKCPEEWEKLGRPLSLLGRIPGTKFPQSGRGHSSVGELLLATVPDWVDTKEMRQRVKAYRILRRVVAICFVGAAILLIAVFGGSFRS